MFCFFSSPAFPLSVNLSFLLEFIFQPHFLFVFLLWRLFSFALTSFPCTTSTNCNIFLCEIELFNDDGFVKKYCLRSQDLRVLFLRVFQSHCETMAKLADIRELKPKRCEGRNMCMVKLSSFFQEDLQFYLRRMWT